MAALFRQLDDSLSTGAFLPDDWAEADEDEDEEEPNAFDRFDDLMAGGD